MTSTLVPGVGPDTSTAGAAAPVDYEARNNALFERRAELVALLESAPEGARGRVARRRAQRELADVDSKLVELNAPLVYTYVNRFRSHNSAELTAEYEAAGMVGLFAAIKTFELGKGRFSSWAHLRIKREVTRAVRACEFSNMNYGDFEARPRILAELEAAGGAGVADLDEVAASARVTRASVDAVVSAPRVSSMDATSFARGDDDGDQTLAEVVSVDDVDVASSVTTDASVAALEKLVLPLLSAREMLVLVRRYGLDGEDPASSAEVGRLLGVSREAARQLESRVMAKLLHPITLRLLLRQTTLQQQH